MEPEIISGISTMILNNKYLGREAVFVMESADCIRFTTVSFFLILNVFVIDGGSRNHPVKNLNTTDY